MARKILLFTTARSALAAIPGASLRSPAMIATKRSQAAGIVHIGQRLCSCECKPSPVASHQAHLEWTPSRMVHWAQTIGGGFDGPTRDFVPHKGKVRSAIVLILTTAGP